ncbi:MAG: TonB-dependent receptor plug domain-containing protein [Bacteroidales bacterium]
MKTYSKWLFATPLFLLSYIAWSGEPDSLMRVSLNEISVVESRYTFYDEDQRITRIDTIAKQIYGASSLGEMMSLYSPAHVKQYGGPGSISSISMRGGNATHTQVNWNGFSLNSVTTAEVDFSLIPVDAGDEIFITHGASGTLFGSGTFGGAVNIENGEKWKKEQSLFVRTGFGSFGDQRYSFKGKAGNTRFQYSIFAFHNIARNDYPFINTEKPGLPIDTLVHNNYRQSGLIQNVSFKLPGNSIIEAGAWYQWKHKNLPSNPGSNGEGTAIQRDSTLKAYASWQKTGEKYSVELKSGYFYDFLRYADKLAPTDDDWYINSIIQTSNFQEDFNYRYYFSGKFTFDGGVQYRYSRADVSSYGGIRDEHRVALIGAAKYNLNNLVLNLSARQEYNSETNVFPVFSTGINYQPIGKALVIRYGLYNKYRLPTFNERYWQPVGNPAIKPEKGWGTYLGIENNLDNVLPGVTDIKSDLNIFSQLVNDWILWVPRGNMVYPENMKKVWSRGMEIGISVHTRFSQVFTSARLNYTFQKVTNQEVYNDNVTIIDKQLRYTPVHSGNLVANISCKNWFMNNVLYFTGERFITDDNTGTSMAGFMINDITLGKKVFHGIFKTEFIFRVSNIFNTSYQVIRSYPMPGRSYHFSLLLGFKAKK